MARKQRTHSQPAAPRPAQVSAPKPKSVATNASAYRSLPTSRQSQPDNFNPYQTNYMTLIPRRNIANPAMMTMTALLSRLSSNSPLKLLALLADIDPDIGLAIDNLISLTCDPADTQIVGVQADVRKIHNVAPDDTGTASLDALFDNQPCETGGLMGLMSMGTMLTAFTGLNCLEAVPGLPMQGVARIWPVDSLTLHLAREKQSGDAVVYQRQWGVIPPEFSNPLLPGYRRMNPETFFWQPWQPFIDDIYGRAMFAPALAEVLTYLAMIQDVRDAVKHVAWPRLRIGFNWTETMKIAVEVMKIKDPIEASLWCQQQYNNVCDKVGLMKADDALVHDTSGTSDIIGGGSFTGLEPIMKELRSRIIRAVKQLPVMMAFNDAGSTEGHTSVQWQIVAKRLEMLRAFVLGPICKAGTLHLRLQGKALKAVAKVEKIRTTDALLDAQAEALQISNAAKYVLLGWKSNDEAAIETTGSGPAKPTEDRQALLLIAGAKPASGGNSTQQGGQTQEEQDAQDGDAQE